MTSKVKEHLFANATRRFSALLLGAMAVTAVTLIAMLPGLVTQAVAASDSDLSRTVDDMTIYIGVIPSEIAAKHLPSHQEALMHGGKRSGDRFQHLVVAVYDAKTNQRIADAKVTASVADPGISTEEKQLEPMTIADTLSYGNYFSMMPKSHYLITVSVRRPGVHQPTRAQFDYGR